MTVAGALHVQQQGRRQDQSRFASPAPRRGTGLAAGTSTGTTQCPLAGIGIVIAALRVLAAIRLATLAVDRIRRGVAPANAICEAAEIVPIGCQVDEHRAVFALRPRRGRAHPHIGLAARQAGPVRRVDHEPEPASPPATGTGSAGDPPQRRSVRQRHAIAERRGSRGAPCVNRSRERQARLALQPVLAGQSSRRGSCRIRSRARCPRTRVPARGQWRDLDGERRRVHGRGMQMRERERRGLADQEQVHDLAVVRDQRAPVGRAVCDPPRGVAPVGPLAVDDRERECAATRPSPRRAVAIG